MQHCCINEINEYICFIVNTKAMQKCPHFLRTFLNSFTQNSIQMTKKFLAIALISSLFFTACKKDPVIPPDVELITTVIYTLSPMAGGANVTLSFVDMDGDGEMEATIMGGTLDANTTYNGSLELLNELETPAESITEEIEEEDEDHQFFFTSTISDLAISYDDQDADGNPVGLSSTLVTGAAASGSIKIILRHEPEKTAAGVSD